MKGIIFNLLEEVVSSAHGPDAWDALLDAAGLEGAYTSLGSYPDSDLARLLAAASVQLGQSEREILRWFGRAAIPYLANKFPHFFAPHRSTRDFLLALNTIIHPEVRKLYPGADVPVFEFDSQAPDQLLIGYRSPRRLCALAEGLSEGAAVQFGETAQIEHLSCMNDGDALCQLRVEFSTHAKQ